MPIRLLVQIVLVLAVVGCAPLAQRQSSAEPQSPGGPAAPKRIRAAFMSAPPTLHNSVNQSVAGGKTYAGVRDLENLLNDGLTVADHQGLLRPRLAEGVPSVENGLWRLLTDGRMEVTWVIREGAQWHDSAPFTAADVAFSSVVARDAELPFQTRAGYDLIESVQPVDARTVRVAWKAPFIQADALFDGRELLPKHILERPHADDKAAFAQHAFWTTDFVGLGPFRLREYVRDSHLILAANERYVLGRPKIDEIEVLFRPDPNALAANLLAGTVELTIGTGLALQTALQVADQWRDGKLETAGSSGIAVHVFPQFSNPRPAVIGDLRLRQALVRAIDRQELVDSIMAARAHIAHGIYYDVNDREYPDIAPSIVQYPYDPGRAAREIEELGYTRAPDGFFRDRGNQRLLVEIRALAVYDIAVKTILPVAAYWQRVGVDVETLVVPEQRTADREYRATRPGFDLSITPTETRNLIRIHGREAPVPQNSFRGGNRAGYINREFDALIDTFFVTIPWKERMAVLGQVVHHITDQVIIMGLFFDVTPAMIGNRLVNVRPGAQGIAVWNAHEWGIR